MTWAERASRPRALWAAAVPDAKARRRGPGTASRNAATRDRRFIGFLVGWDGRVPDTKPLFRILRPQGLRYPCARGSLPRTDFQGRTMKKSMTAVAATCV